MRSLRPQAKTAALTVLTLVGAAVWLSGCGQSTPLDFAASGADLSGELAFPGQAESFAAFLTAKPAGVPFQITRISLIPLRGYRTPRLVGAEFLRQTGVPFAAPGWPPRNDNGSLIPVHPLKGFTVRSGVVPYKIQDVLMFGVRGSQLGPYAVAGLHITYVVNGQSYTTDIYNGACLYYHPRHETKAQKATSLAASERAGNAATVVLRKLPAVRALMANNAK